MAEDQGKEEEKFDFTGEGKAMICQQCRIPMNEGARFCSQCGTPVPQPPVTLVCQKCQSELPEGAKFCTECGTSVPEPQAEFVEKFDFTAEGEALDYISIQQAVLRARRQARENDERYKERFGWGEVVWTELRSETIGEDYYRVVLQFSRPQRVILEEQTGGVGLNRRLS